LLITKVVQSDSLAIRALVLTQLSYTITKAPDIGWSLFRATLRNESRLWAYTERCFYYQYREHYDRIETWLDRMQAEAPLDAHAGWGRILTLACLSSHVSLELLFTKLESKKSSHALQGAAQVFVANIHSPESTAICQEGISRLLSLAELPAEVLAEIEKMFTGGKYPQVTCELANSYLRAVGNVARNRVDLHGFVSWLETAAYENPSGALAAAETMIGLLKGKGDSIQIWNHEPLLAALTAILREADESNDPTFTQHAIELQDELFRLDLRGIEEFLDLSSAS
jgi:hypothetical protein